MDVALKGGGLKHQYGGHYNGRRSDWTAAFSSEFEYKTAILDYFIKKAS